jgi:hypothetical protein
LGGDPAHPPRSGNSVLEPLGPLAQIGHKEVELWWTQKDIKNDGMEALLMFRHKCGKYEKTHEYAVCSELHEGSSCYAMWLDGLYGVMPYRNCMTTQWL